MTAPESPSTMMRAIGRHDRSVLARIAQAEQARHVDWLQARLAGEQDRRRRAALRTRRDEVDMAWAEIALWLRDDIAPEGLPLALSVARAAARKVDAAWPREEEARGTRPIDNRAVHMFGLWMIARLMNNRFVQAQVDAP